jgi:hypothetical protein
MLGKLANGARGGIAKAEKAPISRRFPRAEEIEIPTKIPTALMHAASLVHVG